ncbi:MAG: hypothetical protein ACJAU1_000039 [Psychromonas sp.]|jgi:hypothetical protein
MQLIARLRKIFISFNRFLDKLEVYDQRRKQLQHEERRASVQDNPDQAFADLFAKPANNKLHKPIHPDAVNSSVRDGLPTTIVYKKGTRPDNNGHHRVF